MKKLILILGLGGLIDSYSLSPSLSQGRLDRPTFFRDGQERMEKEIQRLQQQPVTPDSPNLEHPSQLLTIDEGQLSWQKYLFQKGGFSVWMPQGLQSEEVINLNTSIGELSFEVFASHPSSSNFSKSRFIAAYSNPLNSTQLTNIMAVFEAVKQGILEKTNFQLIQENSSQFSTYEGQELVLKGDEEIITFRVYLINSKLYILAVGRPDQNHLSQEIISYFNSFRLL